MADTPSQSNYVGFGLAGSPADEPAPQRGGVLGWARDAGIDVLKGGLGVVRDLGGIREAGTLAGTESQRLARQDMDELGKLSKYIERGKTDAGQYRDEHPEARTTADKITDVGTGILPYAPMAAAGPAAPFAFGALALGGQRVQARDALRNLSPEQLQQAAQKAGVDPTGKSDDDLVDELYTKGTDLTKLQTWLNVAPAVAGNVIGGGALGLMTKGFMRTTAGTITDRILKNVTEGGGAANWMGRRALGAVEGGVGGAAMGGGSAATAQMTEQAMGMRDRPDWGAVTQAGVDTGLTFGAIGALTHRRRVAPPVGTDTAYVAGRSSYPGEPAWPGEPGGPEGPPTAPGPRHPAPAPFPEDIERPAAPPAAPPERTAVPLYEEGHEPPSEAMFEHGAPAPYATTMPEPGPPRRMTGPFAPPLVMPPVERRPTGNISDDARFVGTTEDGRDIWVGRDGRRQYIDPETGARVTEAGAVAPAARAAAPAGAVRGARRPPRDAAFLTAQEAGPSTRAAPAAPPARRTALEEQGAPAPFAEIDTIPEHMTAAEKRAATQRQAVPLEEQTARQQEWEERQQEREPVEYMPPGYEPPEPEAAAPPYQVPTLPTERAAPVSLPDREAAAREAAAKEAKDQREAEVKARHERAAEAKMEVGKPKPGGVRGEPVEPELPYPDRATVRKAVKGMSPEQRVGIARALRRMWERGEHVSLTRLPEIKHDADVERLLQDHPQGVIREITHNIREVPPEPSGFGPGDHRTIERLKARGTPEQHAEWAAALEKTGGNWGRMPKSWREAIKGMERDVNDVVKKNLAALAHELRGERPPSTFEEMAERPPERAPAPFSTEPTEGERRGQEPISREEERAEAEHPFDVFQETFPEPPGEYGPEIEPGERPVTGRPARLLERTLGLRRGRYAPDVLRHMQRQMEGKLPTIGVPRGKLARALQVSLRGGTNALVRAIRGEARAPAPPITRLITTTAETRGIETPEGVRQMPIIPARGRARRVALEAWANSEARRAGLKSAAEAEERLRDLQRTARTERDEREEARLHRIVDIMHMAHEIGTSAEAIRNMYARARRSIARSPEVRREIQAAAAVAAERARKEGRTKPDQDAREKVLYRVLTDAGLKDTAIPADFFDDTELLPRPGARIGERVPTGEQAIERAPGMAGERMTMGEYLDSIISPAGVIKHPEKPLIGKDAAHELPLDQLDRERLVMGGKRMLGLMMHRVNEANIALQALQQRRYPPGSTKAPQISFRVGMRRGGKNQWYDILSDYQQRASLLRSTIARIEKGGTSALGPINNLRTQMLGAYMREKYVQQGKLDEVTALNRETNGILFEDVAANLIKYRNQIEEEQRKEDLKQDLYRQSEAAGGQETKRGQELHEQAIKIRDTQMSQERLKGLQKKLDETTHIQQAMEEMQHQVIETGRRRAAMRAGEEEGADEPVTPREGDILGGLTFEPEEAPTISHLTEALSEYMDTPEVEERTRQMLLDFYAARFGPKEGLPREEEIQLGRERRRFGSRGGEAPTEAVPPEQQTAFERSLIANDERTPAQIEGSKEALDKEDADPTLPKTPDEAHQRIVENNSRIDELLQAVSSIPDKVPIGGLRQAIDTLRYYLRTADMPLENLPVRGGEGYATLQRLRDMLHGEINHLQDDTRRAYEMIDPDAVNYDYRVGRVLDPAADLRGTKERNRNIADISGLGRDQREAPLPPLPRGATVHKIGDFLDKGTKFSIRPDTADKSVRAKLLNHFFDIVHKAVGDVDVVVLTPEQYQLVAQRRGLQGDHPAFYDQATHRIFTDNLTANGAERAYILGHEFMHPLTVAAAERFPLIMSRLDRIRQELRTAYGQPAGRIERGRYINNGVREALGGRVQGLANVHEFISELFNDDGSMMNALRSLEITPELRHELGTERVEGSLLNRALSIIRDGMMRLFMHTNRNKMLNDAVIHSLDLFHSIEPLGRVRPRAEAEVHPFTMEDAGDMARSGIDRAKYYWQQRGGLSGIGMKWHDINQLGRRAESGFREVASPFERIVNQIYAKARDIIDKSKTHEMLNRLAAQSRLPAEKWRQFTDYIDAENHAGLSGADPLTSEENKWVHPTDIGHSQMRERHVELRRLWNQLSPEQKAMRNELLKFSRERHSDILHANIEKLIKIKGLVPRNDKAEIEALKKHVMEEPLTPAQQTAVDAIRSRYGENKFDSWLNQTRAVPQFRKLPGVWYPMMRRGKWVVEGVYKLAKLAKAVDPNAREVTRDQMEFENEAARDAFIKRMAATDKFKELKLLRAREVHYEKDAATGGIKMEDGKMVRAARKGADTITRYRAEYNPLLLEFHDSKFKAAQRRAEIAAAHTADEMELSHTEPVKDRESTYLPDLQARRAQAAMLKGLQGSPGWDMLSDVEKNQLKRDLDESTVRHVMSTSARATYLPRKYALGADKDLLKNYVEYARNTAHTLAETHFADEVHEALKKLDDYVDQHKSSASPGDPTGKYGTVRRQIQQQIHRTLEHRPNETAPMWRKALARTLQMSYIDRLVSPSFLLLNASEPWVLGMPLMAGHHGLINANREIMRAYHTVGALKLMGRGFGDLGRVIKSSVTGEELAVSDNLKLLRDSIKGEADAADLNKLFDYVDQHGYFDRNAGMELEQMFNPDAGRLGRVADYTDNAFRQVNNQVENINRGVTAIASYRLGRQKGMSHEAAMAHAKDMMHDINGNYAAHASAEMFRNPWTKPMLQFKRYGHRITSNYLRLFATALGRKANVSPEQRAVAIRQLMYWTAAQVAVGGMLGLPTEPLRIAVNGLALTGAINWNWDDVEIAARNAAAEQLGPELGMALTRGALRNMGLGIGSRMGYDSLWFSPGSIGDTPASWFESAGRFLTGSPGSMGADIVQGVRAGVHGLINAHQGFDTAADQDFGEFVDKAIPIKAVGDIYRAYSQAIGGRKSVTKGGQPLGYDPTEAETILQALGIRSARQQEAGEFRAEFQRGQKRYNDQKNELLNAYAMADTPAERARIMQHVTTQFNPGLPPELKIGVHQLAGAAHRREQRAGMDPTYMGMPVNRRTREFLPSPGVYNVQ